MRCVVPGPVYSPMWQGLPTLEKDRVLAFGRHTPCTPPTHARTSLRPPSPYNRHVHAYFRPGRNLLLTFAYWNLLKLRYHMSEAAANHRQVRGDVGSG